MKGRPSLKRKFRCRNSSGRYCAKHSQKFSVPKECVVVESVVSDDEFSQVGKTVYKDAEDLFFQFKDFNTSEPSVGANETPRNTETTSFVQNDSANFPFGDAGDDDASTILSGTDSVETLSDVVLQDGVLILEEVVIQDGASFSEDASNSEDLICLNCHRQECENLGDSVSAYYQCTVSTRSVDASSHFYRRKFCTFSKTTIHSKLSTSGDVYSLSLCEICHQYLTALSTNNDTAKIWPIMIWTWVLNSHTAQSGNNIWSLIPLNWRPWWLREVKALSTYCEITLQTPEPVFSDVTNAKKKYDSALQELKLSELIATIDETLLFTIKCPWGCDACYDNCGSIPMEIVVARCLGQDAVSNLSIIFRKQINAQAIGIRDDFLSPQNDLFLFNPEWKIMPSLCFNQKGCPVVLTCPDHNCGEKFKYLHVPRNPYGTLPCMYPDQLAPAVLQSRRVKPVKAKKFSTIYSMHKMQVSFGGIDTLRVVDQGRFDINSILLQQQEDLTVASRRDIRALLGASGINSPTTNIPDAVKNEIINSSRRNCPTEESVIASRRGSTFVTLLDALRMQEMLQEEIQPVISVATINLVDGETNNDPVVSVADVELKDPWPRYMINVHPYNNHGATPIHVSVPTLKTSDTRLVWFVRAIHLLLPDIWSTTVNAVKNNVDWHGWILLSCLTDCNWLSCKNRSSRNMAFPNQMRKSQDKIQKILLQRLGVIEWADSDVLEPYGTLPLFQLSRTGVFNVDSFHTLFMGQEHVATVVNSAFSSIVVADGVNVVVLLRDNKLEMPNVPVVYSFQDAAGRTTFEARFIGVSTCTSGYKWSGTLFSRHGGSQFPCWWQQINNLPLQSLDAQEISSDKTNNWDVVVYIKERQVPFERLRDTFLESCGGQAKVWCKEHNLPHIIAPFKNNNICCVQPVCKKPVRFQCPNMTCLSCCCVFHHKHLISTEATRPIFVSNGISDVSSAVADETNENENMSQVDSDANESTIDENSVILDQLEPVDNNNINNSVFDDESTWGSFSSNQSSTTHVTATTNEGGNENNTEYDIAWSNTIEDNYVFDGNDDDNMSDSLSKVSEESEVQNSNLQRGMLCTVAKGLPTNIVVEQGSLSVPGHVILNNCGTLLARKHIKTNGSLHQRHFLQKIVSSTPGKSTPLVYPETALFPSIFWADDGSGGDGAILGGMPCAMLSSDRTVNSMGIASLQKHLRSRINNSSILCSTDDRYISYAFDCCLNLNCRENDTRVILHRGLSDAGLGAKVKNNDAVTIFDTDSVDSRPVVNKLAAAVRQEQATYFYTHTCNQSDHFGIRRLKRWIDSDELAEILLAQIKLRRQNCKMSDADIIKEVTESASRAAAVATLRNWMIVSRIWMTYIARSQERPIGKVKNIWYRHEFQDSAGNLSHIHALVWIERVQGDLPVILDHIRGSVLDLIRPDEIDNLISESLIGSTDDAITVQEKAWRILRHVCSQRCKKRVGVEDGELQCRVENNGICNATPLQHSMQNIYINRSEQCLEILTNLQLLKIENNTGVHEYLHDALKATKHYPPARKSDGKISACNGRLFLATLSSQNLKYVTGYLASRYLAKYIALVDENNKVYFGASRDSPTTLEASFQFLHNTKITGSAIQENQKHDKRKNHHHPTGRAISMMEMLCVILNYQQVFTDIKFIHVSTTPLEERPAFEKVPRIQRLLNTRSRPSDLASIGVVPSFKIRNEEMHRTLPSWRKVSGVEHLLMKDQLITNVSVDNTTVFGLRPPELRFVRHQTHFFRWFYRQQIAAKLTNLVELNAYYRLFTHSDLTRTAWIDGLGYHVFVRPIAIPEIVTYLESTRINFDFYASDMNTNVENADNENPKEATLRLFEKLLQLWHTYGLTYSENTFTSARHEHAVTKLNMFVGQPSKRQPNVMPVVYFNNIRPTQPNRWVLHILLSMGEFDNELSLLAAGSIRKSFIRAKLIQKEENEWRADINNILKRYILEQLVFVPGGSKTFDRFVIAAQQALTQYILFDGGVNDEIPAVLFSHIKKATNKKIIEHMLKCKNTAASITLQQLSQKGLVHLPSKEALTSASLHNPVPWVPNLLQSTTNSQSPDSVAEQSKLLQFVEQRFDQYLSTANAFTKGIVIFGGPGVGKTTVMQISIIHAIRRGLNILVTAVMAERANQLGGSHIAKTFAIPVRSHSSPIRTAELAILRLLKVPFLLETLRQADILFIDELGQVSAELLSTLDIILRRIRSSSLFMGGLFIVASMDGQQLQPVKGRPPLLSPHMLTSFNFCKLEHYVRSSQDEFLQQIQDITRKLNITVGDIQTFRHLIETHCTFVDSFNDEKIQSHMLRIFGKKSAIKFAETEYLSSMKSQFASTQEFVESVSNDQQSTIEGNWINATQATSNSLSRAVKEPQILSFYPKAQYEVTFNSENQFSQGQLAILRDLPSEQTVVNYNPVQLYLAPDGCKFVHPDLQTDAQFAAAGWKTIQMGSAPDRIQLVNYRIQARRQQYGLRHRIATTIHAAMGQDVPYIVTRVDSNEPQYMLWEHEQLVVLLSRTHFAKNIIFVGDPAETSAALANLLRKRSQFSDYIGYLLQMYTQDGSDHQTLQIQPIDLSAFPYRPVDVELPTSASGYVYLLVSARNPSFTYIGQTRHLVQRLRQHNTGHGSTSTNIPELYPWALLGFICGFEGTKEQCTQQRLIIEQRWKTQRNLAIQNTSSRTLEPDEIAAIGRSLQLHQGEGSASLNYVMCGSVTNIIDT